MNDPLSVRDAAVALGGRPVLRGIDLTVRRGEVVAVLGGNGSGKTTLVRAALGLVPLARGEVRLFGTPLAEFTEWHRIGYVPQRAGAGSGVPATVEEVVSSGRLARRRRLRPPNRTDRTAVRTAVEVVGLSRRLHDPVSVLSGGQQQRVLIARALAGEPDLFVLDEPTAGVDLASQLTLADALHRVADHGATIVLIAHELGPLESLVERVVIVDDGRIGYDGAPRASRSPYAFHDHAHPDQGADHVPLAGGWRLHPDDR